MLCLPYSKTLSDHIHTSRVLVSVLGCLDTLAPAHSSDLGTSHLVNALVSNVALVLVGLRPCTAIGDKPLDPEDNGGYSILHGLIMDRGPNDLVILCTFVPACLNILPLGVRFSVSSVGLISIIRATDLASASLLFVSNIIGYGPSRTKRMFSTMQNVEQWGYLREALLLIIAGHHWHWSIEDQILVELVAPSICSALLEMIQDLEVQARTAVFPLPLYGPVLACYRSDVLTHASTLSALFLEVFVLDSPWTSSLISGLSTLGDAGWGLNTDDERRMALHKRLQTAADSLLVQVTDNSHFWLLKRLFFSPF